MNVSKKLRLFLKSVLSLQLGEVQTDKAVLYWDGEGELAEGIEVFVRTDGDEFVAAPDGDYVIEDGKTIKVVEGKVAEIVDPEAEVAPEEPIEESADEVEMAVEPEEVEPADEEQVEQEETSLEDRVAELERRLVAMAEGFNEVINAIAGFEERIAELEGKLAKVEAPAADPIDETPVEQADQGGKSILSYLRAN